MGHLEQFPEWVTLYGTSSSSRISFADGTGADFVGLAHLVNSSGEKDDRESGVCLKTRISCMLP